MLSLSLQILGLASVVLGLLLYTTAVYSTLYDGVNLFGAVLVTGGGVGTVMVGLVAMVAVIYNNKPLAIFVSMVCQIETLVFACITKGTEYASSFLILSPVICIMWIRYIII